MRIWRWEIRRWKDTRPQGWIEDCLEAYYQPKSVIRNERTGESVWIAPHGPGTTTRGVGSVAPQPILPSDEWIVVATKLTDGSMPTVITHE